MNWKIKFCVTLTFLTSCNIDRADENDYSTLKKELNEFYVSSEFEPYKSLVKDFSSSSKEQALIFDLDNRLYQYVFYNIANNEPRFVLNYLENHEYSNSEGRHFYISSPDFNRTVKDTFKVEIFSASPPYFNTTLKVFQISDNNSLHEVASYDFKEENSVVFVGNQTNKNSQENYVLISQIVNDSAAIVSDSIRFQINWGL